MDISKTLCALAGVCILTACTPVGEENMIQRLTEKQKAISAVAALAAAGELEKLAAAYTRALDTGLSLNELKEITLQLYAYAGFPRCLNAAAVLEQTVKERAEKGIKDPLGPAPEELPANVDKYELGKKNLEILCASSLPSHPPVFIQATDTFLKEHLFADIFARGVLSFKDREIATVFALAALYTVNPQLQAHMSMAMNAGVTEAELEGILVVLRQALGPAVAENAQAVLKQTLKSRSVGK